MDKENTNITPLPLSVRFYDDKRIKKVSHDFYANGESLLIRILLKIHVNGGSLIWNERENLKICLECPFVISTAYLDQFIHVCLENGIFNNDEFMKSSKLIFVEHN